MTTMAVEAVATAVTTVAARALLVPAPREPRHVLHVEPVDGREHHADIEPLPPRWTTRDGWR